MLAFHQANSRIKPQKEKRNQKLREKKKKHLTPPFPSLSISPKKLEFLSALQESRYLRSNCIRILFSHYYSSWTFFGVPY